MQSSAVSGGSRRLPNIWPTTTRKRLLLLAGGAVGVAVAATATALIVQILLVRSDLADVPTNITAVREALLDDDSARAIANLAKVASATESARGHSGGPAWWLGSKLPFVGASLHTTRELVIAVDDLADGPLATAVRVGNRIDPGRILHNGTVAVDELVAAREPLSAASATTSAILARVRDLPSDGLAGPVASARTRLLYNLTKLDSTLDGAAVAARVAPDMLGASGPRTYFVAFQNNAEVKGTGGLLGVYGVLTADRGAIDLAHTGPNDDLVDSRRPVVDLGAEYNRNYGVLFPAFVWSNGNSSPHFPYTGRIWAAQYQRLTGTPVDGVIAVDPEALAHILRATGPIQLPGGRTVEADTVARLLQVETYAEYEGERGKRKEFLEEVARAAFDAAIGGHGGPRELLTQLAEAAKGHHLQVWSAHDEENDGLRRANATGEMYQGPAPYAAAVLNNVSGAKLDYYLERQLRFTLDSCHGDRRHGHLELTLTNNAPGNLPAFVTDRIDAPRGTYPAGQSRLLLAIYLTEGAELRNVALGGAPVEFTPGTELGHPRILMWVYLTPGQPLTVTVDTDEPTRPENPVVFEQPMARAQTTDIDSAPCP